MVNATYIPERGHIVWLDFTPQIGHEQSGRRPALVLSPSSYNHKTGLMICCPLTTRVKGYPHLDNSHDKDRQRWRVLNASQKGIASLSEVAEVCAKLRSLLG